MASCPSVALQCPICRPVSSVQGSHVLHSMDDSCVTHLSDTTGSPLYSRAEVEHNNY